MSKQNGGKGDFCLIKGLLLSLLAGVLSAVYNFALEVVKPVVLLAESHGAGHWQGNVAYLTANTGAFITSLVYCLWLARKNHSLGELVRLPEKSNFKSMTINYLMAFITGTLWYGQFFFYNLGHVRLGQYQFSSWAIHMIMLVLLSNFTAVLFGEWKGCRSKTKGTISMGLLILCAAILLMTRGNYLGEQSTLSK